MGPGNRFEWGTMPGLVFGIVATGFPYNKTVLVYVGPFWFSYGFGKPYTED